MNTAQLTNTRYINWVHWFPRSRALWTGKPTRACKQVWKSQNCNMLPIKLQELVWGWIYQALRKVSPTRYSSIPLITWKWDEPDMLQKKLPVRGPLTRLLYFLCSGGKRYRICYSSFPNINITVFLVPANLPLCPLLLFPELYIRDNTPDMLCFDFTSSFDECWKNLQWFKKSWKGFDLPSHFQVCS